MIIKCEAKRFCKCVCCSETIRVCESYWQVIRADDSPIRGERYCVGCHKYAVANDPDQGDGQDENEALRRRERYAAHVASGCVHSFWDNE